MWQRPYRSECQPHLGAWFESVAGNLQRGIALFVDYGYPRREYYLPERRDGTLVCHYRHRVHDDPFAHVSSARPERSQARGPGWQRALTTGYDKVPKRLQEPGRSAASFAAKPRTDLAVGMRVFHDKFGYGEIVDQEGNKLEIEFEASGRKRVIDSFVKPAG